MKKFLDQVACSRSGAEAEVTSASVVLITHKPHMLPVDEFRSAHEREPRSHHYCSTFFHSHYMLL